MKRGTNEMDVHVDPGMACQDVPIRCLPMSTRTWHDQMYQFYWLRVCKMCKDYDNECVQWCKDYDDEWGVTV